MTFSINPSSFETIHTDTTDAKYPTGCLRYQSVKHLIKDRQPLHPIYTGIGVLAEEHAAHTLEGLDYVREAVIEVDLGDDVVARGRVDFLLPGKVVECKATVSPSKRSNWRKSEFSATHLGQTMSYMIFTDREQGELRTHYFHFSKDLQTMGIEVSRYEINGLSLDQIENVMTYYRTVKAAMLSTIVPPKPLTNEPCRTCPFQAVCDKDLKNKAEFVDEVSIVLRDGMPNVGLPYSPKIKRHDRR